MENEFNWADKRICVTGGAGFLGTHLIANLRSKGAKDIFIPTIEKYDLTDRDAIARLLEDSNPDVIIHLAATWAASAQTVNTPPSSFMTT